ncbi:unnamed protein product [Heligmosomoides polygyrus]|uniref:Reverse transcriptase domain-containing protein n=1 Tax=Heligmosomoides polygyrus TaxID=6339 RepID=A0A183G163_HELPZ|nr:unnamed protein product [Heligmosomoides polygyrus]
MLRWTTGVTRMDRIRNDAIRQKFGVVPIADKMREGRLRWYGHVLRGKEDSVRKIGLNFESSYLCEKVEKPVGFGTNFNVRSSVMRQLCWPNKCSAIKQSSNHKNNHRNESAEEHGQSEMCGPFRIVYDYKALLTPRDQL